MLSEIVKLSAFILNLIAFIQKFQLKNKPEKKSIKCSKKPNPKYPFFTRIDTPFSSKL